MNPINQSYSARNPYPWDGAAPSGARCADCGRCRESDRFEGLGWCAEIGEIVSLGDMVGEGDEFECPSFVGEVTAA